MSAATSARDGEVVLEVSGLTVLYGETPGSLLALSLSNGREVARAEGGAGFSATPTVKGPLGGAISNGGRFLFLRVN